MSNVEAQPASNGSRPIDGTTVTSILEKVRGLAAADPSSNPILLFALDLTMRMDRAEMV